jgi:ubiquitin-like protein Pup
MERIMGIETRRERETKAAALPIYFAADQPQKKLPAKRSDEGGGEGEPDKEGGPQKLAKRGKELKEEMDALVDEIDEVLEENAEEFVKNYVQRGGQ